MPKLSPNSTGALLALAAFGVFASHDAIVKDLATRYSPVQIVFCIALFGFPILLAILAVDREQGTLIPKRPWLLIARGCTAAVSAVMAFYAFAVLPMAQVYAILFSAPLLVTVLAVPLLGERVGLRRALAVAVGMAGVLVVLRPGGADLSLGHLAGLLAASVSALSSIILRKVGRTERGSVVLLYALGGNFILMGTAMPFVYRPMSGQDVVLMMVVAAMAFLAMRLVIMAYRRAEAVVVAPMQYSQMIWAVVFGLLIFDESPDRWTLLGAGIIMASGFYIVIRESRGAGTGVTPVLGSPPRAGDGLPPDKSP